MVGKKGSITLEAAIVLPWFVMILFAILYLIKIAYIHEQIQYAISEAAMEFSTVTYIFEPTELIDVQQEIYKIGTENSDFIQDSIDAIKKVHSSIDVSIDSVSNIKSQVSSEGQSNGSFIDKIKTIIKEINTIKTTVSEAINEFYNASANTLDSIYSSIGVMDKISASIGAKETLQLINNAIGVQATKKTMEKHIATDNYEKWGIVNGEKGLDFSKSSFLLKDNDIIINVSYSIEFPYFKQIIKPLNINQSVRMKAFYGNGNFKNGAVIEKEKEEKENNGEIVYITKNGKVYHRDRNCNYIDVKLKEKYYKNVKNRDMCSVCNKTHITLKDSDIVYCTEDGKIHITKSCWAVKKNPKEYYLTEEIKNKYSPCSVCGGK